MQPFTLKLTKDAKLPRNPDNPLTLNFSGQIPTTIEHSYSMNVLLLYPANASTDFRFIGIASEALASNQLSVKIVIAPEIF